jgi:hypothetical protein
MSDVELELFCVGGMRCNREVLCVALLRIVEMVALHEQNL